MMVTPQNKSARVITAIYFVTSTLWIVFSDRLLLDLVAHQLDAYAWMETYKGFVFVALSSILVYFLTERALSALVERQQAQADLQLSEDRYRNLVMNVPVGIYYTDANGALVFTNERATELIGQGAEKALGFGWRATVHDEDRDRVKRKKTQAMQRGALYCEEYRFVHADYTTVSVMDVGRPELDEDGGVVGYMGTLSDVSEVIRATASLNESEAKFQKIVENSLAGVYVIADESFEYINPRMAALLNCDPATLLQMPSLLALVAERDCDQLRDDLIACQTGAIKSFTRSFNIAGPHDHEVRLETVGVNGSWNGHPAVIGTALDVTLQQRTELALQASEERFRQFMNAGPFVAWIKDADGRMSYANELWERSFGHDEAHWQGKTVDELFDHETAKRIRALDQRALEQHESAAIAQLEAVESIPDKDGNIHHWRATRFRLLNAAAEPCLACVALDITGTRATEEQVAQKQAWIAHLLSATPTVLYALRRADKELAPVWISDSITQVLGYSQRDALQQQWWDEHIHEDDRQRLNTPQEHVLTGDNKTQQLSCEYRSRTKDGRVVYLRDNRQLVRDGDGTVVAVFGSLLDISEQNNAQQRLRLQAAAFEHLYEGILVTDLDGRIESINPALARLSGYSKAELVARDVRVLCSEKHAKNFFEDAWRKLNEHGSWHGEMWLRNKQGTSAPVHLRISRVHDDEFDTQANYVAVFSDLAEIKALQTKLSHRSHHDALTQLPNRHLLTTNLERAIARGHDSGGHLAVLSIEVTNVRDINDRRGYEQGDALLRIVADRLRKHLRSADLLGRIAGNEFGLVLADVTGAKTAQAMADDLLEGLQMPTTLPSGNESTPAIQIGISVWPDDDDDAETLLRHAALARTRARDDGAIQAIHLFERDIEARIRSEAVIAAQLQEAIVREELRLFYQPRIGLASGKTVGAEALLRWRYNQGPLLLPEAFMPVAERTGLIVSIDHWVIGEVCRQIADWRRQGFDAVNVGINLSAQHLQRNDLQGVIDAALSANGLEHQCLSVELGEPAMVAMPGQALATLRPLRNLGIDVAVDDFGSTPSKLAGLRQLPINVLKLDHSLVRDICRADGTDVVVIALSQLAKALGLRVVAEGVELSTQLEALRALACDEAQGFLFSEALPAVEYPAAATTHWDTQV